METDPLSIILVKGDSKGDRLLFRYPYNVSVRTLNGPSHRRKNPYSIIINEDILEGIPKKPLNFESGRLVDFSDEVLSNLFAVKQELWEKKFELKTNDVRFVGHPTIIRQTLKKDETNPPVILVNIVFALKATASHSIVRRYHELSKRLGSAIIHEENRCNYFTLEMKTMISTHDEFTRGEEEGSEGIRNPFDAILERSSLARDLKRSYDDLCSLGLVQFRLNKSIELSFCLPQKVHQLHNNALKIEPEAIDSCLESVRPYHGLLLLVDARQLLKSLSPDTSPSLSKLIKVYSPLKSFKTLGAASGLTMQEVLKMAGHLVYWGKAIVIYPLCESNVYMVAPNAPVHGKSQLVERFADRFPQHSLLEVMSEYSLPLSLKQKLSPLSLNHDVDVQIVIWLLQHRLLIQLHTYVYYMPTERGLHSLDDCNEDLIICELNKLDEMKTSSRDVSTEEFVKKDESQRTDFNSTGIEEELTSIEEEEDDDDDDEDEEEEEDGEVDEGGDIEHFISYRSDEKLNCDLSNSALPLGASQRDLSLLNVLIKKDYLKGSHHLEEIMFTENVKRSELLQLLDKFRDVLVTCEAEDPIISLFYPHYYDSN